MGRLGAVAFAEQVEEGNASLRQALAWHLQSNHYPPIPTFFIPTCVAAIEAGNDGEWDLDIPLPRACATHGVLVRQLEDDETEVHANGTPFGESCSVEAAVTWRDDRDVVRAGDLIESFHLDSFLTGDDYI